VGIDDFAIRRGHVYGTVIIDMTTGDPVELLGDRTADTVAAWLAEHPGIEVVCCDRGGPYADAARRGAPDAVQVADRWHLLHNLTFAVDKIARAHRASWTIPADPPEPTDQEPVGEPALVTELPPGRRESTTRDRHREIHALVAAGVSQRAIGIRLNLDRKTVRKYMRAADPDELLGSNPKRGSELDAHLDYLTERWKQGCTCAKQLHLELRERGYTGAARTLRHLIGRWRLDLPPITAAVSPPTPREVAGWIMRPRKNLSEEEKSQLNTVMAGSDPLRQVYRLVSDFAGMIREHRDDRHLETWVAAATATGLKPLVSFAQGLLKDIDAVRNALSTEWSSGIVEGNVNRIKMIKRMMYGRANFDLLRRRVLLAD
jgi:transposase